MKFLLINEGIFEPYKSPVDKKKSYFIFIYIHTQTLVSSYTLCECDEAFFFFFFSLVS